MLVINVVLVSGLLFGAICNLYFVNDDKKRPGIIAGYTVFFAVCVGLVTTARLAEVFGASAAYVAVLVVFVGNLNPSAGGDSIGSLGNSTITQYTRADYAV